LNTASVGAGITVLSIAMFEFLFSTQGNTEEMRVVLRVAYPSCITNVKQPEEVQVDKGLKLKQMPAHL